MSGGRPTEVADGVHMLGTKWANFYLVVDGGECLVVDAGYTRYWGQLERALERVGRSPATVAAVIATHHHVDHVGTAEHLRRSAGARVLAHERDASVIGGERRSHVPPRFYRQAWRPSMARYLVHSMRFGGARYRPVAEVERMSDGQLLDLPGRPRIVHTPGHTAGHCSVLLEDRGVLFAGDAMVNFDYASGRRGLGQHRFNDDRRAALASLDRLNEFDAETVLFGHGEPWTGGLGEALTVVRERSLAAGR